MPEPQQRDSRGRFGAKVAESAKPQSLAETMAGYPLTEPPESATSPLAGLREAWDAIGKVPVDVLRDL